MYVKIICQAIRETNTQTVILNSVFIINYHLVQHFLASATAIVRHYHLERQPEEK